MEIIYQADKISTVINTWKDSDNHIAFVPTMGALHEGHLSLIELAKSKPKLKKATKVVVSIYVNPTQFSPNEDFKSYPRTLKNDLELLKELEVDLVYLPTTDDIYPHGVKVNHELFETLTDSPHFGHAKNGLESDFRPHFFDGVITVVYRLFEIIQPHLAIFGEKDLQQLKVIQEMVEVLNLPIEVIGGETKRDDHGLALSSRNSYLDKPSLKIARQLNVILQEIKNNLILKLDSQSEDEILEKGKKKIIEAGFIRIDYLSIRWNRLLVAIWLDHVRLIDNIIIE